MDKPNQIEIYELISEGVVGGIYSFIVHNRVSLVPMGNNQESSPLKDFVNLITAEYSETEKQNYPFKQSLFGEIATRLEEERETIGALIANKEDKNLRGLLHIIGAAAVASILEENKELALRIIRKLRGLNDFATIEGAS